MLEVSAAQYVSIGIAIQAICDNVSVTLAPEEKLTSSAYASVISALKTIDECSRIAEAVHAAFSRYHPGVEAVHIDILDYVAPWFRKAYLSGYYFTINRLPFLWGFLYKFSNRQAGNSLSRSLSASSLRLRGRIVRYR